MSIFKVSDKYVEDMLEKSTLKFYNERGFLEERRLYEID